MFRTCLLNFMADGLIMSSNFQPDSPIDDGKIHIPIHFATGETFQGSVSYSYSMGEVDQIEYALISSDAMSCLLTHVSGQSSPLTFSISINYTNNRYGDEVLYNNSRTSVNNRYNINLDKFTDQRILVHSYVPNEAFLVLNITCAGATTYRFDTDLIGEFVVELC